MVFTQINLEVFSFPVVPLKQIKIEFHDGGADRLAMRIKT